MGTITAQSIIDRAAVLLFDTTKVRWQESELLNYLNAGQRQLVMFKPDASVTNEAVQLAVGTKQAIPAAGVSLVKVTRNMGFDGETPGNVVKLVPVEILDTEKPDWHAQAQVSAPSHYVFDPRDPKRFYVEPPSKGDGYVEIVYSATPTNVAIGNPIALDDIYENQLLDYVLFRAYSKDSKHASNMSRAQNHWNLFTSALGIKEQVEFATEPKYADQRGMQ